MSTMPRTGTSSEESARVLLELIVQLDVEMKLGGYATLSLDSSLERDLGLDSLGRTELLLRVEKAFQVSLPEQTLTAETPRELLQAVQTASGQTRPVLSTDIKYQAPGKAQAAPSYANTLVEVLDWHLQTQAERSAIHLYEQEDQPETLNYADLHQGARAVASGLRDRGLEPGQTVAIMLPTSRGYFFSFFGILLAGGTPVPIYPPVRPSQIEEHLRRHSRILANARSRILITVPEARMIARLLKAQVPELEHIVTADELSRETSGHWISPPVKADDIAFLQYTSGSTGDPKGVVLTHANLLANLRAMGQRIQVDSNDVFVSWLPLYHDMGLIGACLGSIYFGFPLAVMSPLSFLARPARWLWAIHRHSGTLAAAPNFAYELCLRNIQDEALQGLDLSSWRFAFNGAEPVSPDTMRRFGQRFAPYGLRPQALAPVYGLAECSVGLALPKPERGLQVDRIHRDAFMDSGQALPAAEDNSNPLEIPACGHPLAGHEVRIVDEQDRELPERQEGRLQFKGPSATSGYLRNPEASHRLFHGGWLDSGDKAYIVGGDVYLTGRIKDVIIRGGRNIYPYELEQAVGVIAGIRKGCVAAFASTDPESKTERLIVVAETRETSEQALEDLRQSIRNTAVDLLATPPDEIVLAPPHTVLKTSSGKIRRTAICELYEQGTLERGSHPLWWQLTRLVGASVLPQSRRLLQRGSRLLFAAYSWMLFGILTLVVWALVAALPRLSWRWTVIRCAGRVLGGLTGTQLQVSGLENLLDKSCVLVANHSSYLDSLALVTAIPKNFSYVGKRELMNLLPVRIMLQRLGTVFVERFDLQRSAEDSERITERLHNNHSLVLFPEGTLKRMPGLQSFRMGAFVAAAKAGVPVIPIAIRGTRSILRGDSWFPRHGSVRVIVGQPIAPEDSHWQAAVKLRDAARTVILRHCGEPDLATESV